MRSVLRFACVAFLALQGISQIALAQDAVTYRQIEFHTQTADGQTIGCGMEFTYHFRDRTYSTGAEAAANGSIWFYYDRQSLFGVFKIGGVDFPGGVLAGKPKIFPVAGVTIVATGRKIRPKQFQCEKPENFCGGFAGDDMAALFVGLEQRNPMRLLFNRVRGGLDYDFPLGLEADKDQDAQRYGVEYASYRGCMGEIIERATSELKIK